MSADVETLESRLVRDLQDLSPRFGDERFCAELYRALTNRTLSREGGAPGHLLLSWTRAEDVVNRLRASDGLDELPLAQSGGEGVISQEVLRELDRRGWRTRPLNSSRL